MDDREGAGIQIPGGVWGASRIPSLAGSGMSGRDLRVVCFLFDINEIRVCNYIQIRFKALRLILGPLKA